MKGESVSDDLQSPGTEGEPPLSQCGVYVRYAEPWPDLPLTLFATTLGERAAVTEVRPDALLGDFFGSHNDAVFRVEAPGEASGGPWWVLAQRGCGLVWDGDAYPGWERASGHFLDHLGKLAELVPERRIGEVMLRYVDLFEVERSPLLHDRVHWPVAQGAIGLPLMTGDVPLRFEGRARGRIQYLGERPVNEDDTAPPPTVVHGIVTTSVFVDFPQERSPLPNEQDTLKSALGEVHTYAKRLFWDLLKSEYRETVKDRLFSSEEQKRFTHTGGDK